MVKERNHKSKERFVVNQATVDSVVKMIRGEATMKKETSAVYYADEIRLYKMPGEDVWYCGVYGPEDRRRGET